MTAPAPDRCPSRWVQPSTGRTLHCDRQHTHRGNHAADDGWGRYQWTGRDAK